MATVEDLTTAHDSESCQTPSESFSELMDSHSKRKFSQLFDDVFTQFEEPEISKSVKTQESADYLTSVDFASTPTKNQLHATGDYQSVDTLFKGLDDIISSQINFKDTLPMV